MTHRKAGSFYDILGVDPKATPDQIRRAFLAQARRYHPDLNRDDPRAEWRFKQIRRVYEVLIDPLQRAAYDDFPARFSLDDVGNDWINRTTIVTEPDRHSASKGADPRHRATGAWSAAGSAPWPHTGKTVRRRSGWAALSAIVLVLLGIVALMLPQPNRPSNRRALENAATGPRSEPGVDPPVRRRSAPRVPKPSLPSQAAASPVPASIPEKRTERELRSRFAPPDGIDQALQAVLFPDSVVPWNALLPPAGLPGPAPPIPLPTTPLSPRESIQLEPWPFERNPSLSALDELLSPLNVPTVTVDLQPKPPLADDPLVPLLPPLSAIAAGFETPPPLSHPPRWNREPIPPATTNGFGSPTYQLDAVGRENLVTGLRERLNPKGAALPTFPSGLPTSPPGLYGSGPSYPLGMGALVGFSPAAPIWGSLNGLPFLPSPVLSPSSLSLPQRPALPAAPEMRNLPPYFGPAPPVPHRP